MAGSHSSPVFIHETFRLAATDPISLGVCKSTKSLGAIQQRFPGIHAGKRSGDTNWQVQQTLGIIPLSAPSLQQPSGCCFSLYDTQFTPAEVPSTVLVATVPW
jgi:hypothetical protein